ncbi:hypothetical protein DPMN_022007 [Dreissena polymorpha]|uniref:Uncharacterized protein n=1 Tax=Dreissena polymorpha TaxID=45954 RepID=A0A9D4SAG9_DREPO|nr:hypothetical protein DPMN_022007 [Dreissena polymorpha]
MLRMWGTSMKQKESTSSDIKLANQQHHEEREQIKEQSRRFIQKNICCTPFDSQPEVYQNSNLALNNICKASISAQLLSFSKHFKPPR